MSSETSEVYHNAGSLSTNSQLQRSRVRFLGNLKSKQYPLRSVNLHYFRSDVVARTHLCTKFGAPVRDIPFETVRCDYRRPSNWYDTNIFGEMCGPYGSMDSVLPFFQKEHHTLRRDKVQVTNNRRKVLGIRVKVM